MAAQRRPGGFQLDLTQRACSDKGLCRSYAHGWAHLAAVIDCPDREIVDYEFARRGRAKEAERALEEACPARSGTLRPPGRHPSSALTMDLSFRAGGSGRPVAPIGFSRNSSRHTHPNRTA